MLKLNSKLILCFGALAFLVLVSNCKKDGDGGDPNPTPNPVANSVITSLSVADVGDAGNGTDLNISFSKIADESMVSAYQVFVVKSAESAAFNLETAESTAQDRFLSVAKTGSDISINLSADSKTSTGELIANDVPYKVFVLSLTADPLLFLNALSASSAEITLMTAEVPPNNIANLVVEDTSDEGNGLDLKVSFDKVPDESMISEYRILVVKSEEAASFDLETAENTSLENYILVEKTGNNIAVNLAADAKIHTGELIGEDVPYRVFVLTIANDPTLNTLSEQSEEITLTSIEVVPEVTVTYIANDGVMIEFEGKKVMIDGMNTAGNLGSTWVSPSASDYQAVENGEAPFDDIDVIMVTHNHGDHYAVSAVRNYLTDHPNTKLVIPNSIKPNFSAFTSQISNFTVPKFERVNIIENEISIDVLHIEHFDQFGNDFSAVESYAYLIHFGDKTFLHTGDIDYVDSQLDMFNLLEDNVHVVFIPTFGNLVNVSNRNALINHVAPENIVCLHFIRSSIQTTMNQINNIYPGADSFTTPFETRVY